MALRAKGKAEQADMVKNILPAGVECIFVRQPEQLGLGHAVLCAERAVGNDPFAVLLADDFLTYEGAGVTADLARALRHLAKPSSASWKSTVLIFPSMGLWCQMASQDQLQVLLKNLMLTKHLRTLPALAAMC